MLCQRLGLVGIAPGLLRFAIDVDLQQHVQRYQVIRTLLAQPANDLGPIRALNPVEALGNRTRLVGLDRADEMPLESRSAQLILLGAGLIEIVLAEARDAGGTGTFNILGRPGLAYCEQSHAFGAASRSGASFRNPFCQPVDVDRQQSWLEHFIGAP